MVSPVLVVLVGDGDSDDNDAEKEELKLDLPGYKVPLVGNVASSLVRMN